MNIYFDEKSDIVCIYFDDKKKVADSEEVNDGVVLDYDESGNVIGIEIMGLKGRVPLEQLKKFNLEVA